MKNLICILIISFASFAANGNIDPNAETQNVLALSGLKLRATPDLSGQLLKVIPFGERIEVIENTGKSNLLNGCLVIGLK